MRSDSEVLAQIASDVAEIKAAVFGKSKAQEPFRADLTPEAACEVVERWRKERGFRADLPPRRLRDVWTEWEERHSGLTDFRGDLYRGTFSDGTRDQWRPMTQLGGFKDPGLWYFRPHGTTWAHVERLAQERAAQSIKADLAAKAAKDDSHLTDLRKLEGRVCKSSRNLTAKASKGRFAIPIGAPFRVIYAHLAQEIVMVEHDGTYGWISPMQEVEVIDETPKDEKPPDLRNVVGCVCKSSCGLVAYKVSGDRLQIPAGEAFFVKFAPPARDKVIIQYGGSEGWIPALQEVEEILDSRLARSLKALKLP